MFCVYGSAYPFPYIIYRVSEKRDYIIKIWSYIKVMVVVVVVAGVYCYCYNNQYNPKMNQPQQQQYPIFFYLYHYYFFGTHTVWEINKMTDCVYSAGVQVSIYIRTMMIRKIWQFDFARVHSVSIIYFLSEQNGFIVWLDYRWTLYSVYFYFYFIYVVTHVCKISTLVNKICFKILEF